MRPAFYGLGRAALERRVLHLIALPSTAIPRVHQARIDRAFALRSAWADMERAEALNKPTKGVFK